MSYYDGEYDGGYDCGYDDDGHDGGYELMMAGTTMEMMVSTTSAATAMTTYDNGSTLSLSGRNGAARPSK